MLFKGMINLYQRFPVLRVRTCLSNKGEVLLKDLHVQTLSIAVPAIEDNSR